MIPALLLSGSAAAALGFLPLRTQTWPAAVALTVLVALLGALAAHQTLRACGDRAPQQHRPLLIALVGAAWAAAGWRADGAPVVGAWLYLLALGVVAAAVDLHTERIPALLTGWALIGAAVLLTAARAVSAATTGGNAADLARAALAAGVVFVGYLTLALATRGGMGMGDVKLAPALGLVLGFTSWAALYVGTLLPFALAAAAIVATRRTRPQLAGSRRAFGPYLVAGAALSVGVLA